ncbi:hypothetical protein RV134_350262 [Roseovarius sp. EC-HK134]|nr:hypothetical protein RV134_350262 [Roseovarius sp. EC-HK134]VVT30076.1 hypothetical protein RV420_410184 [Roseovarius sp. EC-SD190]
MASLRQQICSTTPGKKPRKKKIELAAVSLFLALTAISPSHRDRPLPALLVDGPIYAATCIWVCPGLRSGHALSYP